MGKHKLGIVIPAFNEEKTISELLSELLSLGLVILVDDCSSDKTNYIATKLGVNVIKNNVRSGYETSLNVGICEAFENQKVEAVITMDADGKHGPNSVNSFKKLLLEKKVPLVMGIRQKNRFAERFIGYFIKAKFGVSDIFCGMKGYRVEVWKERKVFDTVNSLGTELSLSAIRGGYDFKEVIVPGKEREDKPRIGSGINITIKLFSSVIKALLVKPIKKTKIFF